MHILANGHTATPNGRSTYEKNFNVVHMTEQRASGTHMNVAGADNSIMVTHRSRYGDGDAAPTQRASTTRNSDVESEREEEAMRRR